MMIKSEAACRSSVGGPPGADSAACRWQCGYLPVAGFVLMGLTPVSVLGMLLACVGVAVLLLAGGIAFLPQPTVRFLVWSFTKLFYRVHVYGQENVPAAGPVLLAANHVSWLDGVLLMYISRRPIRMVVYEGNFRRRTMRRMARIWGAIMVDPGPKKIVQALRTARAALENGEVVGLFPEGGVTRSGVMQGFRPGITKILQGTNAAVVPVYFDGLWGSIFSYERGKLFWKIPRRIPYPVYIHFGKPLTGIHDTDQVRQAVQELGAVAVNQRIKRQSSLPQSVIRACKQRKFRSKIADSTDTDLTGGQVLMRALILRRLLRRQVLGVGGTLRGRTAPAQRRRCVGEPGADARSPSRRQSELHRVVGDRQRVRAAGRDQARADESPVDREDGTAGRRAADFSGGPETGCHTG